LRRNQQDQRGLQNLLDIVLVVSTLGIDSANPKQPMNFTRKLYPLAFFTKSNLNASVVRLWVALLVAASCLSQIPAAQGAVVFDNISNYENTMAGAAIASTSSTPNTFMGDGYNLIAGVTSINGFDIFPVNLSGTDFDSLKITIYVWGSVNLGVVGTSTPAFGNLLATYTLTASGGFPTGFYFPFEAAPAGSSPGITLTSPLAVPSALIGITFSYQGSTDGGTTFNNANHLTSLISYGTPASVGTLEFNGYYRNAASEVNGNFTSALRSLGQSSQSLALRVFGTASGGGNHQPVADAQTVTTTQDTSADITLTASDLDGDPLTFNVATSPVHGSLSGAAPTLTYQPNAGYVGPDSFTFTANDGQTDSVPASVDITVNPTPTGLVIIPQWDVSITSDPKAAGIMNTINNAIQIYETKFRDPVTVNIKFQEMGSGLGMSSTFFATIPYQTFYDALVADSKTTNDTVALANVAGGSVNPVDGNSSISLTTANCRALGININPGSGNPDSTISVNMSLINITRKGIDPTKYDLQAVVSHEIDEALGSSSGLGSTHARPADLFRYSGPGTPNYTTSGDSAFFSIDGGNTLLVQYNQNNGGDYGDWWSFPSGAPIPRVQDAFGTPGATPNLGVELTVLDVVGYDLAPPAPPAVFQSVSQSAGQINLTWSATYGRSYQVQYTTSLGAQSWHNVGSPVIANGPTASASDNIGPDTQRFYRVGLLPQPMASPVANPSGKSPIIGPLQLETRYLHPAPSLGQTQAQPLDRPTAIAPERAMLSPIPVKLTVERVK
jgi:hypothetical protein